MGDPFRKFLHGSRFSPRIEYLREAQSTVQQFLNVRFGCRRMGLRTFLAGLQDQHFVLAQPGILEDFIGVGPPDRRTRLRIVGSCRTMDECSDNSGSSRSTGPPLLVPSSNDHRRPMSRRVPSEKSRSFCSAG